MRYYPAYLDIQDRPCLVVGGGRVGTRKAKTLLACGARVTVISPEMSAELNALADANQLAVQRREYNRSDLNDIFLVVGATSDPATNRRIHSDAEKSRRLCNIADQPELSNFVLPAVVNRGDLNIAISTGGKSPAFAKHLRKQLEAQIGPEYGPFLKLMGAIRKRLLARGHAPEAHKALFDKLIRADLLQMVARDDEHQIDALLNTVLGPGYHYRQLLETDGANG